MTKNSTPRKPSAATMRAALKRAGIDAKGMTPKALIEAHAALDQPTEPTTQPEATPAPAKVATAKPAPANCGCGCGQPTITAKAAFLSGHDARHAGNLGRALAADPTDEQALAAREALTAKLQAKVDGITATARKHAAAKAAREAAKVAAKRAYDEAMASI